MSNKKDKKFTRIKISIERDVDGKIEWNCTGDEGTTRKEIMKTIKLVMDSDPSLASMIETAARVYRKKNEAKPQDDYFVKQNVN